MLPNFGSIKQNDLQEFLKIILDNIGKKLNEYIIMKNY